ncbi:MAG: GntR family transcriptional regulator [Acidimicrobiales bacterium]
MPTLEERIVEHLATKGASLDDAELAEALGVRRPVIAETCRRLEARGLVVRNMAGGTRTAAPPAPAVRARPAVAAPTGPGPAAEPVPPPPAPARAEPVAVVPEPTFADHARRVLSARWGTSLRRRLAALPGGDGHPFELVSGNGRIVGDVVWLADRGQFFEAKSAAIAEAVLIVGHVTNADRRFLVFGEEWDAVSRWVTRYRLLLEGVELWFLDGDRLERLA